MKSSPSNFLWFSYRGVKSFFCNSGRTQGKVFHCRKCQQTVETEIEIVENSLPFSFFLESGIPRNEKCHAEACA